MTGARLPEGADAVVPVEWTDGGIRSEESTVSGASTVVTVRQAPDVDNAVRHRGDDVAEGEVLLPEGTLIGPVQMALLAASGQGEVLARTPPRVAVISTGNELVEPGTPLIPARSGSPTASCSPRPAAGPAQPSAGTGSATTRPWCSAPWKGCSATPTC